MNQDHTFYELVADFEEYPGNFERELTWFAFGVYDDHIEPERFTDIDRPHAESMFWAGGDPEGFGLEGKLQYFAHDEYGTVPSATLSANEVKWEFMEPPTREEWLTMVRVFEAFRVPIPSYASQKIKEPTDPKLRKLTLRRVEVTYTEDFSHTTGWVNPNPK